MKNLTILCLLFIAITGSFKSFAQDDFETENDSPSIVPPPVNQAPTPPIIDESDSGSISDADEYDSQ